MTLTMTELLQKKKRGGEHTDEELRWLVAGITDGSLPDYQLSAWLMAVCLRGMTRAETLSFTQHMARSGDMADLSALPGVKADKHSTGGVGDKTTLVLAPLAAACGLTVAKMSGRGLGFTGGTVDKLESIPGFRTELNEAAFIDTVRRTGLAVVGQSGSLAPADKRLYALRDVTATVESLPLIAASIMSKKLAAGADCILLDVKCGSGAFMKTQDEAAELARLMVDIGHGAGRQMAALVTDMNRPLGSAVGNALELREAVDTLQGRGPEDLTELCLRIVTELLLLASRREPERFPADEAACAALARARLADGAGFQRLCAMVTAQGGDAAVLHAPDRLCQSPVQAPLAAWRDGYVTAMNAEGVGLASLRLGAGRLAKDDAIDHAAGLLLHKKPGDAVRRGEPLATLHCADEARRREGEALLREAVTLGDEAPAAAPLVYQKIS